MSSIKKFFTLGNRTTRTTTPNLSVDTTISTNTVPYSTNRNSDNKVKTNSLLLASNNSSTEAISVSSSSSSSSILPMNTTVQQPKDIHYETLKNNDIKLIVFDFDQCVLGIHSYALRITPDQVWKQRNIVQDFCDYNFFCTLIPLLSSLNISIAIASFGKYEVIQAYLDKAFNINTTTNTNNVRYFTRDNISTPSSVGGTDGWSLQGGKNIQLTSLINKFQCSRSSILFFDDDINNIRQARDVGFCNSIHCPTGFDFDAWSRAIKSLSLGPDTILSLLSDTTTTTTTSNQNPSIHPLQSNTTTTTTKISRLGIASPPTLQINELMDPSLPPIISTINTDTNTSIPTVIACDTTNNTITNFVNTTSTRLSTAVSLLPSTNINNEIDMDIDTPMAIPTSPKGNINNNYPGNLSLLPKQSEQTSTSSSSNLFISLPVIDTVMDMRNNQNNNFIESETPRGGYTIPKIPISSIPPTEI